MDGRIRKKLQNGAVILELDGPLRMGPYLNDVMAACYASLEQNPRALIIDLTNVGSLDTAAIGELIQLNTRAASRKTALCLTGVSARIRHLLEVMRLDVVLACYADSQAALEASRKS
jgi:anti-anti-sigma factor